MLITEYSVETRYPDCDAMGVVHHAVWPIWYEAARIDWLEQAGFPFALSQEKHVNPAMVDLHMQYKGALGYPERLTAPWPGPPAPSISGPGRTTAPMTWRRACRRSMPG